MSGRILNVKLTEFFFLSGQLIKITVPAGTVLVVDTFTRFNGLAKFVLIDNLDAVNNALYRVNSRASEQAIVRPSSSRAITMPIELLEVTAGAGGTVELTFEIIPMSLVEGRVSS